MGLEGCVCKRAEGRHFPGRNGEWIKVKCKRREDFIIIGYLNPESRNKGLAALLLGTIEADGTLRYEGSVGTGFSAKVASSLLSALDELREPESSLRTVPRFGRRGTHWVRPELVAEIEFLERTNAGELRHASFKGLRRAAVDESR